MMTVQDLMDFLQVSRSSVYRLIERKVFPVYKIEGITRFKRDDILKVVWGKDHYFASRSLDVFISRLRKLLKSDESIKIENIHNVGFRLTTKS